MWGGRVRSKLGSNFQSLEILTKNAATTVVILSSVGLSSCTNNLLSNAITGNTISLPPATNGSNQNAFTITQVVQNSQNPTSTLDIIGDGSGALGTFCVPKDGNSASSVAATVCNCTFSYSTSTAPNIQADIPVSYHETNLVRCPYTSIPSNVTQFNVSIHITSADTYSNELTFKFNGNGVSLDPTLASSFARSIRYQCRDVVSIQYPWDNQQIYDPIQSDDHHITYPLDYYTSNLGSALSYYIQNSSKDTKNTFDCPPIPNPDLYLKNPLDLAAYNSQNHLNMNVYSVEPLPGNQSINIYPPDPGTFDRSTFYLAKQSTGVFNVPVNAYIAPNLNSTAVANQTTDDSDGAPPPLGYGASPVATSTVGEETCPDTSVQIPSGYHWVKVWLFRATLPVRQYSTSPTVTQLSSISCNAGDWENATQGNTSEPVPIWAGCYYNSQTLANGGGGATLERSIALSDITNTTGGYYLADRVMGTGICVHLQDWRSSPVAPCTSSGGGKFYPGAGCTSDGFDLYTYQDPAKYPTIYPYATSVSSSSSSAIPVDPMNMETSNPLITDARAPYTQTISNVSLDTASRYDFLYVVTPVSITLNNMKNADAGSPAAAYIPYRFFSNTDCIGSPLTSVSATNCSPNNIIHYGLKIHDVSSNGDPPASDPSRGGVFPVCALQPD